MIHEQGSAATNVTRGFVILNGVKKEPIVAESSPAAEKRPLWFVMTGMGAQWHEMGKDMLKYETFRRYVKCELVKYFILMVFNSKLNVLAIWLSN